MGPAREYWVHAFSRALPRGCAAPPGPAVSSRCRAGRVGQGGCTDVDRTLEIIHWSPVAAL